ncbi:MAG: hypothetical protein KA988_01265 [Longilinea sp.]|nr:hypothetical protein [Longilinea sp.]MCA1953863.1 hypothetical protein [Anaerolinea sp.]
MTSKPRLTLSVVLWLGLVLLLAGCSLQQRSASTEPQQPFFVPPTLVPPTPIVTATAAAFARSTQELNCTNGLTFLSDQTIPDGSQVEPGSTLSKVWEVKNSGTCSWTAAYRVKLIAGDPLGAAEEQALVPTLGGSTAALRIVFQAPTQPGNYRSAWQAYDPQGEPFGDPFFIDFVVVSASPPTPTP